MEELEKILFRSSQLLLHRLTSLLKSSGRLNMSCDIFSALLSWPCSFFFLRIFILIQQEQIFVLTEGSRFAELRCLEQLMKITFHVVLCAWLQSPCSVLQFEYGTSICPLAIRLQQTTVTTNEFLLTVGFVITESGCV